MYATPLYLAIITFRLFTQKRVGEGLVLSRGVYPDSRTLPSFPRIFIPTRAPLPHSRALSPRLAHLTFIPAHFLPDSRTSPSFPRTFSPTRAPTLHSRALSPRLAHPSIPALHTKKDRPPRPILHSHLLQFSYHFCYCPHQKFKVLFC